MRDGWRRASRSHPCPVCKRPNGEHKSTWCIHTTDGTAAICPFVQSDRLLGDAGYLHRLGGGNGQVVKYAPRQEIRPTIRFDRLALLYMTRANGMLGLLATGLGVSEESLIALNVGWNGTAMTFPMRNEKGLTVGIRLREPGGKKSSVRGGKEGCFVPAPRKPGLTLICEGPTDTAAALTIGFDAVGKPSCLGGEAIVEALCRGRKCIVMADNDGPGMSGAQRTAGALRARIIKPPPGIKDLRAWISVEPDVARQLATEGRR